MVMQSRKLLYICETDNITNSEQFCSSCLDSEEWSNPMFACLDLYTDNNLLDDPYNDKLLMNFLKTGRYLAGSSSKKCKRIKKLCENLVLINEILWYSKDPSQLDFDRRVPEKTERRKLCLDSHILGHFGVHETYLRLKKNYYCPNMVDDVKFLINRCLICIRNNRAQKVANPAIAIPVNGLFDKVGMDLVFGLPESKDGFKGILVFKEFLSKYPHVVPIKSKSMTEMASGICSGS